MIEESDVFYPPRIFSFKGIDCKLRSVSFYDKESFVLARPFIGEYLLLLISAALNSIRGTSNFKTFSRTLI
ncbi:MAG: hypothetical protein DMF68_05195 [Acidobacteria bacterium]|nr:MAG: hypothetical protein DMF68_05195 [Acidobacteriota bacterium]